MRCVIATASTIYPPKAEAKPSQAPALKFGEIVSVVATADDTLYVCDRKLHCIYQVKGSQVKVAAGIVGRFGYVDSGDAHASTFRSPSSLALDENGDLFIADTGNRVIRKLSDGLIYCAVSFCCLSE